MHKLVIQAIFACLIVFQSGHAASLPPASARGGASAPLETNGLVAQMLRQVDRWGDNIGNELHQAKQAVLGAPSMLSRFGASFSGTAGKTMLILLLSALAILFCASLTLEWGMWRMLRRPRQALIAQAQQTEQRIREQAARAEKLQRQQQEHLKDAGNASQTGQVGVAAAAAGEMHAPPEGVALVRSQRDGVDQIEAVNVGAPAGHDNGSAADASRAHLNAAAQAARSFSAAVAGARRSATSSEHMIRVRQLPFALGVLLLDLLPVALFFFAAALLLHWLGEGDQQIKSAVQAFIDAYVSTRVTMAVLRLLISPADDGVPLLRVRREISTVLYTWLRRIVVTAAFGTVLADVVQIFGASAEDRLAVLKIVSLLVHLLAVALILGIRRPVRGLLAPPPNADGVVVSLRRWLAQGWTYIAITLVMGIWVVWALGIQDGFPKLIHFIVVTTGIIIAARILTILMLGLLNRSLHGDSPAAAPNTSAMSITPPVSRARLERYYPVVQRLVSIVINVCTVVALLQVWGLDAVGWLMHGAVGHNLLTALLTIAIAALVAFVVWDIVNSSVEKRLAYWTEEGEVMRAARLRTLLPILRTCLFIAIVLVVGLTALNEIGINTTPLLASASIVGVALGFGSQKLVQDFITGIFLLMENAMQVGDWVTVAGVSGLVEHLSIRTVRLRAGDGSLHIVPFSSVSTVNNANRGLGNAVLRISVGYGTDIEQVTNELKQIGAGLRNNPAFKDQILNDIEVWGVDAIDGSMVTLLGQIRCTDKGRWGVQRELNRQILERFRQLGIRIADPRTTMLLSGDAASPHASRKS